MQTERESVLRCKHFSKYEQERQPRFNEKEFAMSDSAFALIVTTAIFAGLAAWPVFLDGLALRMQQHPLQRLMAELQSVQAVGLEAKGLEPDSAA